MNFQSAGNSADSIWEWDGRKFGGGYVVSDWSVHCRSSRVWIAANYRQWSHIDATLTIRWERFVNLHFFYILPDYSKTRILWTCIVRIHAYSEVILIPRQKPFWMIRKNEG